MPVLNDKELELLREFRFAGNPLIDPYANDPDMRDLRDKIRIETKKAAIKAKLRINQSR